MIVTELPDFDPTSAPISTEPEKKPRHGFRIFLLVLLVLALGVLALCYLVQADLIENPFPDLLPLTSSRTVPQTQTPSKPSTSNTTREVPLTDESLISEIDALFAEAHSGGDNYYIFNKSYQNTGLFELVYYDVADGFSADRCAMQVVENALIGPSVTSESDEGEVDKCQGSVAVAVTESNYELFPMFRYTFKRNTSGNYEYYKTEELESQYDASSSTNENGE